MSQRWPAVGNTVSNLIGQGIEPETSLNQALFDLQKIYDKMTA